ncbi:S1C family serine protease [Actinopolymorpha alba]|uniref:S1C family serine protease n=1 Tax=Actinopolymorpha alba TaxID=533267 RepID=UPI00036D942A|nr:trypsin-like peptidase domain-containing protein [Actinopolymorpha alba]
MAASGAVVCVVLAGCTGGGQAPRNAASPGASIVPPLGGPATSLQQDYELVVRQVRTSVVQINTRAGLGSGIVYDKQGHIVTNAHVVGSFKTFEVTLATGGAPLRASLVASYPPDDLAVIRVEKPLAVAPAKFADSSQLAVGQIVLAMGNPLGLSGSVTEGIVSAVDRTVAEPASETSPGTTITRMIQTSAAINPGNSGGALVDLTGKVVGIPTLAATDPQLGGGAAPGIGFAIPSNTVTRIAGQIIKSGRVVESGRAALGVTGSTVTDAAGAPVGVGVVAVRAGSGAAKAGIRPGDIITAINGTKTPTSSALSEVVVKHRPGETVKVTFTRQGTSKTVKVTLGEL